ncbi:uncharacterized protein LOC133187996 [Saccostrea echinata]|uniref:uncharacterized protein LOC133187996 n=1 Tax=Saccostrea echinata TaxID=191078 RepID=UPI002A82EB7D|nr:uncharacterized protein LOC133187996 [Saccostrea echinata]
MKINFLLVLLLGLLAVSYGFQLRGRNRGGSRGGGGNRGGGDDDNDDDGDDGEEEDDGGRRGRLPRLIVEVIARRIQQQLQECSAPELEQSVTTYRDAFAGLSMLLLADCSGDGYTGPTPPGPSGSPPTGPPPPPPSTGNPPVASSVVPAREFDDKVVRELLAYLERKGN